MILYKAETVGIVHTGNLNVPLAYMEHHVPDRRQLYGQIQTFGFIGCFFQAIVEFLDSECFIAACEQKLRGRWEYFA